MVEAGGNRWVLGILYPIPCPALVSPAPSSSWLLLLASFSHVIWTPHPHPQPWLPLLPPSHSSLEWHPNIQLHGEPGQDNATW